MRLRHHPKNPIVIEAMDGRYRDTSGATPTNSTTAILAAKQSKG